MAELRKVRPAPVKEPVDPTSAIALMRNVAMLWESVADDQDRSDLLHAIYGSIVVTRERVVEVQLTPHAFRHGLALALPESVGLQKRPRQDSGPAMQSFARIPIVGRREWVAAARESA